MLYLAVVANTAGRVSTGHSRTATEKEEAKDEKNKKNLRRRRRGSFDDLRLPVIFRSNLTESLRPNDTSLSYEDINLFAPSSGLNECFHVKSMFAFSVSQISIIASTAGQ